jgi:hypothetical protein
LACSCHEPPFHYLDFRDEDLGVDPHHAEVMLDTCKKCGTMRLVYIIVGESFHDSRGLRVSAPIVVR